MTAATEQLWYGFEEFIVRENFREYLIRGWLIAHGITALLAKRGTGKSSIALDIGCHIALDLPWCGQEVLPGWKVIYICGEDDEGMILNGRAWAKYHGKVPPSDRFLVAKDIIKMTNRDVVDERIDEMKLWAAGARCLVILDTWQRATAGLSSNADYEMVEAHEHAERMAAALNGPMLVAYHPPKTGNLTIKGSGSQEDVSSGIWELEETSGPADDNGIKLTISRAKGKGKGNFRLFRIEKVELEGEDFYGDPLEGIVMVSHGGTEAKDNIERTRAKDNATRTGIGLLMLEQRKKAPHQDFSIEDMAKKIRGLSITVDGTMIEVGALTKARQQVNAALMNPLVMDGDGYMIELHDTGHRGVDGGVRIVFTKLHK